MGLVKKNEEKKPEHPRKNVFWTLPRKKKLAKKFNNFFSDVASSASSSSTGVLKRKNQLVYIYFLNILPLIFGSLFCPFLPLAYKNRLIEIVSFSLKSTHVNTEYIKLLTN